MLFSCLGGGVLGWLEHDQWRQFDGSRSDIAEPTVVGNESQVWSPSSRGGDQGSEVPVGIDAVGIADVTGRVATLYDSGRLMTALDLLLISDRLPSSVAERH